MKGATPGYLMLAAVTFAGYAAMGLWTLPAIRREAGGLPAFDVRPTGYTLEDAQVFLASLSEEGRALYGGLQAQLDAVFPALLFATLAIALWHLTPYLRKVTRYMLILIPALGMAADGFENVQVRTMLIAGAEGVTQELVGWASFLTVMKSAAFLTATLSLLVVYLRSRRTP